MIVVRNEMLQKDVADHIKGKEDQRSYMSERELDIVGEIGISSGDNQEKKAEELQTSGKETSVCKDYDRRKGGRQQRKRKVKKNTGRRFEAMERMENGRTEKRSGG